MKAAVLLVDDDPLDLAALRQTLERWDLDVTAVRSGREALARLAAAPADLVVSDVRMPEMSGEELAQAVGASFPGLPVVLITGHADVRAAVAAMKRGAFDYVLKPPDPDEFRLALERALEHARLRRENAFLRAELSAGGMYGERLVGRSPAMQAVFATLDRVARTDCTVLLTGETGTGKELVAQTLHCRSARAARPLVALNCAALPAALIESELFGHERGAFTGAVAARRGRFEEADGGTLFLDEIAETSPEFQAKLLRVLQEGTFERLGSSRPLRADVRLIASTNRDLDAERRAGRFREDLFYRLNVVPIRLPPLRERAGDVALLAAHFAELYARRYGARVRGITDAGLAWLAARDWPGNVRELQHAVERAVVLADREWLEPADFAPPPAGRAPAAGADPALAAFLDRQTRDHVLRVLDEVGWRKQRAADLLGVDRATLYRLLQKHGIERAGAGTAGK